MGITAKMKAKFYFRCIRENIEKRKQRSAWDRGVTQYALELVDELEGAVKGGWVDIKDFSSQELVKKHLLNGARDWSEYSWGGCTLIYNEDIAERLCSPSELKKTNNGRWRPNKREEWLDVQARALYQACHIIMKEMKTIDWQI